jgi:hypothetical protein
MPQIEFNLSAGVKAPVSRICVTAAARRDPAWVARVHSHLSLLSHGGAGFASGKKVRYRLTDPVPRHIERPLLDLVAELWGNAYRTEDGGVQILDDHALL